MCLRLWPVFQVNPEDTNFSVGGVRTDGNLLLCGFSGEPVLFRKASALGVLPPVPRPTQVVGLSILRCSSESLLRNSANCPRNFGRRGTQTGTPHDCGWWFVWGAEDREKRLFIKNIGAC